MSARTPERTTTPAAWHADPRNSSRLRWWDGASWTEHVVAAPEPPVAPEPEPAPLVNAVPAAATLGTPTSLDTGWADFGARTGLSSAGAFEDPFDGPYDDLNDVPNARPARASREPRAATMPPPRLPVQPDRVTSWVWALALVPLTALGALAALAFVLDEPAGWQVVLLASLPYALSLFLAFSDADVLKGRGHERRASRSWALLGALPYLVARGFVSRYWPPVLVFGALTVVSAVAAIALLPYLPAT